MLRLTLALCVLLTMLACGEQSPQDRHVPLDGQSNFRDLGGYETADGRRVRFGMMYRSGTLAGLSDRDVETLGGLGIRTVVNFLDEAEIRERGADRLPEGTTLIAAPISGEDLAEVVLAARTTGDFSGMPVEFNPGLHRTLVKDARSQYATLIRAAADPEAHPLVFHCSHGVHRTGTAAAILLSALGVPWRP